MTTYLDSCKIFFLYIFCVIPTGIRGWYPIGPPLDLYSVTGTTDSVMGAVRLQARLTGPNDISDIIDSASKLGYQTPAPGANVAGKKFYQYHKHHPASVYRILVR